MSDVGAALAGRAAADGAAPQRAAAPKKRIAAYDIARGIAMLAVIVGHTNTQGMPATIVDFCYSFDMPLFFIISGYFCRPDARLDRGYVLKNARALLLPYALTCVILLALMAIRGVFFLDEGDTLPALLGRWTVACLYGSGGMIPNMPEGIIGVGAIWYLLALFWAKLLLTAANRSPYTPAIVLGLFVFGYVSGNVIWLPWSVQPACCAVLFMWIGQKVREKNLLGRGVVSPLIWMVALFVWLWCGAFYGHLYMVQNAYDDGVLIDLVGGVCGSLCVLKGSELLEAHLPALARPLEKFGTITLGVFCMHLVEMDAFPWGVAAAALVALPGPVWVWAFLLRLLIIAVMSALLWLAPRRVSGVFFPARRASFGAASSSGAASSKGVR